ncbi:hypothetical protein J1G43_02755 [Cellulomonas sp. zg-ZUI22]|uniref:hypothetical protein n=1 Tax=Cellulomonas sp. zg-ZUI22 TaxID=2816955 RepID=UPI001A9497C5|nr:hypothetical protein [Cellulomonas sp. zg-ZUI22]MBO0898885.1 hypothetical protein [Cellulomonas sp. zg-ZUI22]
MVDPVARAQGRVDELRRLLQDLSAACEDVPGLARPAGAVGAPGSWTGSAADRLHHEELAPAAQRLPRALDAALQAVRDELAHAERTLRGARESARGDVGAR